MIKSRTEVPSVLVQYSRIAIPVDSRWLLLSNREPGGERAKVALTIA
jgi:hypothetical protein